MDQNRTVIDPEILFGNYHDFNQRRNYGDGFETYRQWPEEIGSGFVYMIQLRPGLVLGMGNCRLTEHIEINFDYNDSSVPVIFGFIGSGSMNYAFNSESEKKKDICHYKPGRSIVAYLPKWRCIAKPPVGIPVSMIGVHIDPALLKSFMTGRFDWVPTRMRDIINGTDDKYLYQMATTTSAADLAIHQTLHCPYQGPLKRMYLESKALELITHGMARFAAPDGIEKKAPALRPNDIERVHHARDLIKRDFQNPPKLLDLARAVGLAHTRLNFCFREMYGTTIFGYLRDIRLKMAKALLDEGRMNVTEAAYEVGYSSLSHFAKAFKNYYGIGPGNYLRQGRPKSKQSCGAAFNPSGRLFFMTK